MKSAGSYSKLTRQAHFVNYLIACFLGAVNDNAYKMIVTLIALSALHSQQIDVYFILAQIVFTAPYLIFSGIAGFLADKFSKKNIIIATKIWEVLIMILIFIALPYKNRSVLVAILFLLTTQSVFFSPAKYAIMPEIFREDDLSRANGLLELVTFMGAILGSALGGFLINYLVDYLSIVGLILIGLSLIGTFAGFKVKNVPAAAKEKKFNINIFKEIFDGIAIAKNNNILLFSIFGISMFFALALGITTNLTLYGRMHFHLNDATLALLNVAIGLGVGTGSLVSGWLSGDKIEPSLIPLGVIATVISCFGMYFSPNVLYLFISVASTGFWSGIFSVPLNAILQDIPAKNEKGRLIATNNFFGGIAMISIVLSIWLLMGVFNVSSSGIMLFLSILASFYAIATIKFCPEFFSRTLLWFFTHILYRVRTMGVPDIPYKGAALIIANRVSFLDGLLLSMVFPRTVHCIVPKKYFKNRFIKFLLKLVKTISSSNDNNHAEIMLRDKLLAGKVVCLFIDNDLKGSYDFTDNFKKLTEDFSDLPIAPVYIEQFWDGRDDSLFGIKPFTQVTVSMGDSVNLKDTNPWMLRQNISELSISSKKVQKLPILHLGKEFLSANRLHPWRFFCSDLYGNKWSYGKFIDYCLLTAQKLYKHHKNDDAIGIFMPPSVESILLNVSFSLLGKTVINLSSENISTFEKVDIIYTNHGFFGTSQAPLNSKIVYWEDINLEYTTVDRILVFFAKLLIPSKYLMKIYGDYYNAYNFNALVFDKSSKAINLSQQNIFSNIFSIRQILKVKAKDKFSCLHIFSDPFSYIFNLWFPLIIGSGLVCNDSLYNNKSIIRQLYKSRVTVLFDNIKGYESYYKLASSKLFAKLKYSIVNESIDTESQDFLLKFCRKMQSNLISSLMINDINSLISFQVPSLNNGKYILTGHVLPNISVRIVDKDNKDIDIGSNKMGVLQVKTANFYDSWFDTNISAMMDNNGLLYF